MAERSEDWSGTLVLIGQPAEERISGARKMVRDGLYERFPKPDYALAFHVSADGPSGKVTIPQDVVAWAFDIGPDGISEEILNLLVKLPKLKVSSRTSSFAFKGKDFDIPTVANRLNVSTVLEGSVRKADDRVRITAQLIDTESDSHLWSETYDRELKDVFGIQDDIAQSIVDALEVTLTPKERRAIQYVATSNAQAYDYYLRGRKFFYSMTKRNFHHAVRLYNQAIKQDPNYALAYAGIADAHSLL